MATNSSPGYGCARVRARAVAAMMVNQVKGVDLGFFDEEENVQQYFEMADGYDGAALVEILKQHLPGGSTVLELGMGPGKDLDLLKAGYLATGSDSSRIFLERYKAKNPEADVLELDAARIETDRRFDCIYSNKVLHHLKTAALRQSFKRQHCILNDAGLILHSFWHGDKEECHHGLLFVYYTETTLLEAIGPGFEVVESGRYDELEKKDSFFVLMNKV